MMSRVILFHCHAAAEHALLDEDVSLVHCDESEEMLCEVASHRPDVVVYEIRPESLSDLAVLRLLRRIAPWLPFVLVGEGIAPETEIPAELEPLYRPLPETEEAGVREAVHSALAGRAAN
jgi:DNA-binding NtrC family response regulator